MFLSGNVGWSFDRKPFPCFRTDSQGYSFFMLGPLRGIGIEGYACSHFDLELGWAGMGSHSKGISPPYRY